MTESGKEPTESVFTFRGKRYDIKSLPGDVKDLVGDLRRANLQLRKYQNTVKVLTLGTRELTDQLDQKLKGIHSLSEPS
ncbi:MAG TPA: DUF6447 family protein [Prochlorococcus sp.]